MVHTCNPNTSEVEAGGPGVQGQPLLLLKPAGYMKPCLKQQQQNQTNENYKSGLVAYTCIPSTWETETGGFRVQGQPGLLHKAPLRGRSNKGLH